MFPKCPHARNMPTFWKQTFLPFLLVQKTKTNVNINVIKNYSMKSPLPIKWVRPEKIPCILPAKSGDLKPLMKIDTKEFALEFQDLEELKTADENVKKLFTLEFFPYKKSVELLRSKYLNTVKRHEFDYLSPEARVGKMTADIRDMQKHMETNPTDKRTKVRLKETIDKRKKVMKYMREWDYKCFEWVLEKLDLTYKPFPDKDVYKRIERKRSLRMLTDKYCEDIISRKLLEYRKSLEAQQEQFLKEKLEALKWIMKEERACGVEPSVCQEDIDSVCKQLENLQLKKEQQVTV